MTKGIKGFQRGNLNPSRIKGSWNTNLTEEIDERVRKMSEKMRQTIKRRFPNGRPINSGNFKKGHIDTDETRKKKSESHKGIKRNPHSDKTKQKIRLARLNQKFINKDTSIEILLQKELKKRNIQFKTHPNIDNICQPDIVIPEKKIIIQADGDYWHHYPFGTENDKQQDEQLRNNNWIVCRFWEHEIREHFDWCIDFIEGMMNRGNI